MVVHACNLSTQEAEAGGFLHSVQGNPGLQSDLQDSQSYTEKPYLKKHKKQTNKKRVEEKTEYGWIDSEDSPGIWFPLSCLLKLRCRDERFSRACL
jgi:hypothetical protein